MTIEQRALSFDELHAFDEAIGLSRATGGRHAWSFLVDLYVRTTLLGQLNPAPVIREILAMEGAGAATGTKRATPFRGPWLGGLWHRHFVDTSLASLATNIQNSWTAQGLPWFANAIKRAEDGTGPKFFTVDDVLAMTDDLVHGAMRRRREANALTGEWIVHAIYNGQNHYLALWNHHGGDEQLRRNIERLCVPQFPFLRDILAPLAPGLAADAGLAP